MYIFGVGAFIRKIQLFVIINQAILDLTVHNAYMIRENRHLERQLTRQFGNETNMEAALAEINKNPAMIVSGLTKGQLDMVCMG